MLTHFKIFDSLGWNTQADIIIFSTFFYRPQQSWGKVIFSGAHVKNSVHRGSMNGRGPCMAGGVHGRGACMARGCMAGGVCGKGGMHGRGHA